MTTKTMKSAIIAGLTALVILGCFAGAVSAADAKLNFTFNGSTTPIYTLNGVDWIPYVSDNKPVSIDATLTDSEKNVASYLLNMTFMNGSKKLLPVFVQANRWDQINVNDKNVTSNGDMLFDSAVIDDEAVVSVNGVLFNMSIIPNEDNVSYYKGVLTPYEINISYAQSELGTNTTDDTIAGFNKTAVKGYYKFNILPDPFYNFTVYGTKYYDNDKTNPVTAYVYLENGFNNNGKVIVATNISADYESESAEYYKLFNLTMKYGTDIVNKTKGWNATLDSIKNGAVEFNTTLNGETDMTHAGEIILNGTKWSDKNSTNFNAEADLDGKKASEWNMENKSVAYYYITLGPKAYNSSADEYNGELLGEWNTNVSLPRLVSEDNYTNCKDTWWNGSVDAFTAIYGADEVKPTKDGNLYNFTFNDGSFIVLNFTNEDTFNITKVSESVNGNEKVVLKFVGYKLGDVNFDESINLVDSAVIGVMIGKDAEFTKADGTATIGLTPVEGKTAAVTFITADITKTGEVTVNDLRAINMYLIGTVKADGVTPAN